MAGVGRWACTSLAGKRKFSAIRKKFVQDLQAAQKAGAESFAFVTNQELRLAERQFLLEMWPGKLEVYHWKDSP
jgi:hypothetical protein